MGIYCSDELIFQGQSGWVASCVFPLFFSFLGILMLSSFQKCYSRRWIFGVVLFLFCFVLGFMRMNRQMQAVEFAFGSEETTYRMFLVEEPQIKERNVFCRVLLTERIDSSYRKTTLNHKAIVYLSRDSLSECLGCGDELIAYTGFSTPANNGNPDEFDYARFLLRHQVSAIGNVHTGKWRRISQDAIHSFRQKAFDCRERVLAIYRHLGFQGDDFAVLSALTVGYKEGLSEEIRESFSVSGSSHVLAYRFFVCVALVLSTVVAGALAGNGGVAYLIDHCISLGICFFHRTVCFGGSFGIYVFFICFVGAEPAKEFFFEYAFCGGFLYASLSACLAV